jgi:hypothetical protein
LLLVLTLAGWGAGAPQAQPAPPAPTAATIIGPTSLFADDAPSWQVAVTNATGAELHGALVLRSDKDPSCSAVLAAALHLAPGAAAQFTTKLPPLPMGDQKLQVVLRDATGAEQVLGALPVIVFDELHPVPGMNLVRNASFELGPQFSGTPMREGAAFYQMFVDMKAQGVSGPTDPPHWVPINTEGWWAEGPSADGVAVVTGAAHSGSSSLRVQTVAGKTRAVESALNRMVPAGPVTLSAWVKTQGCTGQLDLDLDPGQGVMAWQCMGNPSVRQSVTLPANSDWTRLTVTSTAPNLLQAVARIQVDQGTAWLDDVQIEAAPAASAFNVRPEEFLRLGLAGADDAVMAKWIHADKAPRQITVYNDSRLPLTGTGHLWMGSWDHPTAHDMGTFNASQLTGSRHSFSLTFSTADLPVNAYIVCLTLDAQGKTLASGLRDFAPDEAIGGALTNGDLRARTALRFAIAPNTPPVKIFGVGNCTLSINGSGSWWGGWTLASWAEAKPLGLTTARMRPIDDVTYLCAAAGVTMTSEAPRYDEVPAGAEAFANPAAPGCLDLSNPGGWAAMIKQAQATGRLFAANPFIVDYQMSNEQPYPNLGHLCPSAAADADFRGWCQKRFGGDLAALNAHWQTTFTSWDQVEQIASARFLAEVKNTPPKQGVAALDWTAETGNFSDTVMARMRQHPGWSMDWIRWWTDCSLRDYLGFRAAARQFDHRTMYGTNLACPPFWPQMWMRFLRETDDAQTDMLYTSGLPRSLGNPAEQMDTMEMGEGTVPGKPIWGHEIYYEPNWPLEFIAMQNWGLIAHGMTNDETFAWHPYADYGQVVGNRAWEKPDALPMWFIIDNDGTKLPAYYSYVRSINEIHRFHQQFNGLSLKRAASNVGFYVSPDTGCYVMYDTGNRPWNSVWERTRTATIYALRMSGATVSYFDDETLPSAPGAIKTIIVPAAYVLSQPAAQKLADFAKAGGTVVLAGMSGVVDPWLAKYPNVGGAAWADLNWQAPDFNLDMANQVFVHPFVSGGPGPFRGTGLGTMPGATPILDAHGKTAGWVRAWGQGKLVAYGIVPDSYTIDPHSSPEFTAWLEQWRQFVDLPMTARWVSGDAFQTGPVGTGSEVVEVVVREKSPAEKFVFCMNQGGPGTGTAEVTVTPGTWTATDALTGQPVAGSVTAGVWKTPLTLDSWGYRVIRLVKS